MAVPYLCGFDVRGIGFEGTGADSVTGQPKTELLLLFTPELRTCCVAAGEHASGVRGDFCAAKLGILPRMLL